MTGRWPGSISTPRPTSRSTSPHWTPLMRCGANWTAAASFWPSPVKRDLLDDLDGYGLTVKVGPEHIFPTPPTAVAGYEPWRRRHRPHTDPRAGTRPRPREPDQTFGGQPYAVRVFRPLSRLLVSRHSLARMSLTSRSATSSVLVDARQLDDAGPLFPRGRRSRRCDGGLATAWPDRGGCGKCRQLILGAGGEDHPQRATLRPQPGSATHSPN